MRKIICKKTYDTNEGQLVKKVTFGAFGDPTGYEESLYVMPDGAYFLYTNGGAESKYPKGEDIARKSKSAAEAWLEANE